MKISVMKVKSRSSCPFVLAARRIRSRYVFFTLAVLGMVGLANTPLRADPVNSLYDVNGTMTIMGNNVCGLLPCTETIKFSFMFGYNFVDYSGLNVYEGYIVPGTGSVTSYGALGSSFSLFPYNGTPYPGTPTFGPGCSGPGGDANYFPFTDSSDDEIDLHGCADLQTAPVAPSFNGTDLYSCETTTCVKDFIPPNSGFGSQPPQLGIFLQGSVQTSAVAVPEGGPSLGYLFIAMAPIGFAIRLSKRDRARRLKMAS